MKKIKELIEIIAQLRHPETGCPWDRKQNSASLVPNFIEEVYEAVEAIEDEDSAGLCEELGDVLLHVIFQIQLAAEQGKFTMDDVLSQIIDKLIRRHPHIFGDKEVSGEAEVKYNWEKIKLTEKKANRQSVLEGVPRSMPALIQAHRIQEKAAHVGFDWDDTAPVFDKIQEEIQEVKDELDKFHSGQIHALEEEIGDLYFAVVNLSRKLHIDGESALRKSTQKFKDRFMRLESLCKEQNISMNEVGLEKLDELWEFIKKNTTK